MGGLGRSYITVEEYQQLTGLSYHAVLTMIRNRQLPASKVGNKWHIHADSSGQQFSISELCKKKMVARLRASFSRSSSAWICSGDIYCNDSKLFHFEGHETNGTPADAEMEAIGFILNEALGQRATELVVYFHCNKVSDICRNLLNYPRYADCYDRLELFKTSGTVTFLHDQAASSDNMVNPKCQDAVNAFNDLEKRTRSDYTALKTFGPDGYSSLSYDELCAMTDTSKTEIIKRKLFPDGNVDESSRLLAAALRWHLRGLSPSCAAIKASIDSETYKKTT